MAQRKFTKETRRNYVWIISRAQKKTPLNKHIFKVNNQDSNFFIVDFVFWDRWLDDVFYSVAFVFSDYFCAFCG